MGGDELIAGRPKAFWEAMAFFLTKERIRHKKDIININNDLDKLKKLGIDPPFIENDVFIEVP